jgi:deoxyribonuclease-4
MATQHIRVRNLLSHMDSQAKAELKKLLPQQKQIKAPETDPIRYPNALLTNLPPGETYTTLGFIAEELLRFPSQEINQDTLITCTKKWFPTISEQAVNKITKSQTTQPFIDAVKDTRAQLEGLAKGTLRYDEAVQTNYVEGHPDARTEKQIFEVKMTGQLKENWLHFLHQVFAYAALAPEATDIYLVFPMQKLIWHYDVTTWTTRTQYRDHLNKVSLKRQTTDKDTTLLASILINDLLIGSHRQKFKSLPDTIHSLGDYSRPWQIFLGPTQSSKLSICDEELAATANLVQQTNAQVFVHSQYIINLCQEPGANDDYHTALLIKNLQYSRAAGFKGVVVHVGKSTDRTPAKAIQNMKDNLKAALEHASPECPILLETPAGQGTETLTNETEFIEFVLQFQDPRLRICVDTCHVFATGMQPLSYIERLTKYNKKLLKLIHFNDSATPCGSCVDRHASPGLGHIGIEQMSAIGNHCHKNRLPMVIE